MKNIVRKIILMNLITGLSFPLLATAAEKADSGAPAFSKTWKDKDLQWGACPPLFKVPGCEVSVIRGNPAEKNADLFFKVPKGYRIPWHSHTSAERMVLVNGKLEVTYKGQDTVTLKKNTYAYGPPKKPHSGYCVKGPCVLFIAFEQPVDAIPN